MQIEDTDIPDIRILVPEIHSDERGYFCECYRRSELETVAGGVEFVQDNQSGSSAGVLRGLHYQIQHAQGKLVRAVVGAVFDVAVDLRQGSPSFGRWVGVTLSADNKKSVWIPPGFAHGFYTLSEWAEVFYKVTEYFAPAWERTLRWDDPALNISWPLNSGRRPIVSKKDSEGSLLGDAETYPGS